MIRSKTVKYISLRLLSFLPDRPFLALILNRIGATSVDTLGTMTVALQKFIDNHGNVRILKMDF